MGCDIHMTTEIKIDGQWENYDHFRKNMHAEKTGYGDPDYELIQLCSDRDYQAFSQLCGVRSYKEENQKISDPKGIPEDCSEFTKQFINYWDADAHSHSHVTLEEIIKFRANLNPVKICGMITEKKSADLDNGIKPDSWCRATNQSGFVYREWEDSVDSLAGLEKKLTERAIEFWWHEKYIQPENIRIVFFFDN